MMVVVAQSDGGSTERERVAITVQMAKRFGATSDQAEALLARARWLAKDSGDASETLRS
jgi:uncharacterized tellurite resistance protein B-like protein